MSLISNDSAEHDDAGLCRRLVDGEAAAEAEFVRRFSGRLKAMAISRTRDVEASREIVDDVLMATITALRSGTVKETGRLGGFVHGTAVNLINNYLRSRGRRPVAEPLPDDLPSPDGAERLETEVDLHALRRCVLGLPVLDRTILTLTFVDGLAQGEIAVRTGLTVEAVRQRRARALKRLKEMIGDASRVGTFRPQR